MIGQPVTAGVSRENHVSLRDESQTQCGRIQSQRPPKPRLRKDMRNNYLIYMSHARSVCCAAALSMTSRIISFVYSTYSGATRHISTLSSVTYIYIYEGRCTRATIVQSGDCVCGRVSPFHHLCNSRINTPIPCPESYQ